MTTTSTLAFAIFALAGGAACTGSIGDGVAPRADGGEGLASDGGSASDGTTAAGDSGAGPRPGDASNDSSGKSDGAATKDASPVGPVTCTSVGTSDWYTYGHDPERTSASDGCMVGPLSLAWTYAPSPPGGGQLTAVEHAIATHAAVYVKSADNGSKVAAVVDKVSLAGQKAWQWTFGDFEEHQWTTFAFGVLVVEEDSMWFVDDSNGSGMQLGEYDDWGTNTADGTRFYVSSDVNSKDGYGIYVGASTSGHIRRWRRRPCPSRLRSGTPISGAMAMAPAPSADSR